MPGAHTPTVHQLKLGLQGAAPPLWRRFQVPSAASLGFLHDVIQEAFGWDGYHLHRFQDGRGREWGEPPVLDGGGYMAATFAEEEKADLGKVLRAEGSLVEYVYAFGDRLLQRVQAEKIIPLHPAVTYPRCTVPSLGDCDSIHPQDDAPTYAEEFAESALPPSAEPAAQARRVPLIDDALRLAEWCAPGRQVTAKGVLKPPAARQAVEELRLWQRDDKLADPRTRADALADLRSAADLAVLDVPWRFAFGNGLIAIRSSQAVPGPDLPDPNNADQLLSCWQEAFEEELGALDDMGGRILPGMLSMLADRFGSVVFPVLNLLYRLPCHQCPRPRTLL